ncbi:hypothetical protein [Herbidospora cretacea]|uniref:hypothetical protein n=1 Tax=Herbidospora cretacea TaxID=28444 RepID=UPI000773BB8F|nr:hypothetical protein [Herbidospora cretacea]
MAIWHGPKGIEVDLIILGQRPLLRVTQVLGGRRWHIANCKSVREVAELVDLADLVEVIPLPVRAAS